MARGYHTLLAAFVVSSVLSGGEGIQQPVVVSAFSQDDGSSSAAGPEDSHTESCFLNPLRSISPAEAEKEGLKDYKHKIGKDLTWGGTVFDVALIITGAVLCFAGYKLVKFAFILTGLGAGWFGTFWATSTVMTVECLMMMDSTAFKQFFINTGAPDSAKTTHRLLGLLLMGLRGYGPAAAYWVSTPGDTFDDVKANAMSKTGWWSEEPDHTKMLMLANLKELTGGARIWAAHKHCRPFEFSFYATVIIGLNTNNMPRIDSLVEGIGQRLAACPFSAKFVSHAPTAGTNERQGDGNLKAVLGQPTHEKAIRWRDERVRMLMEHMRDRFVPEIINAGLTSIPMPPLVQQESAKILAKDNPMQLYFMHPDCPFVVTGDAADSKGYGDFKQAYKANLELLPPQPGDKFLDARVFKGYMSKIPSITYHEGTRKYRGVANKMAVAAPAAAGAAAQARAAQV